MAKAAAKIDMKRARAAKDRARRLLADEAAVCGIGIAAHDRGYAVRVNVETEAGAQTIPEQIDGVPVVTKVTGRVRKQSAAGRKDDGEL